MIKRLYLANGTLQTPLSKTAEDISVDAGLASYILSVLTIGDWAYLTVEYMDRLEVIKVYLDYSGLGVVRGQDGTCTQGFPTGANVVYRVTQAEIQDATPASTVDLYADGAGALTVTGEWVIGYAPIAAQTEGGIRAYFSLEDATLHLVSWYPAAGCLSIAGNGAPLIGGPFFYLTSQPYPVEVIDEYVAVNPTRDGKQPQGFGPGAIWSLTQPSVTDGYVWTGNMNIGSINVYGSEGSFSVTDEYVYAAGAGVNNVNTYGTEGSFSVEDIGYVSADAYILQMLVYGSEVQYNFGVDQYLKTGMAINSVTVE